MYDLLEYIAMRAPASLLSLAFGLVGGALFANYNNVPKGRSLARYVITREGRFAFAMGASTAALTFFVTISFIRALTGALDKLWPAAG